MRRTLQSLSLAILGTLVGLLLFVGVVGAAEMWRHPLLRYAADEAIRQDVDHLVRR
jgi:hypothetical protein